MLTKEYINELKIKGNDALSKAINEFKDNGSLTFFLEKLGHLPKDFDGDLLTPLLNHESPQVRLWAAKNIGKLEDVKYLQPLSLIARQDSDSMVRREAVSSIGRMRHPQNKTILLEMLNDPDPKIVLQAIRGLLVFKSDKAVERHLKQLYKHPNEMIQTIIHKEYFAQGSNETGKPHSETYDFLKNVVVNGDARDILNLVPNESIHLTFTSPPYYNARDYSIYQSYQEYIEFLAEVFKEVYRVTKEGRFLVLNTSPIIIPRVSRQHSSKRYPIPFDIHPHLVNMGWEFIDDIIWLKPESSVKNRNAGFLQHRKPLGYKPNPVTEYLMVYRKKTEKLIDWNIRQYDWDIVKNSKVIEEYETSNVWKIDPTFSKVHTAVFPLELCNRVIKFYSFKGDLVFDPFAGSGTLGRAAKNLERLFFLTEKNIKYFHEIRKNLDKGNLFTNYAPRFFSLEQFKEFIKNDAD